ncbi:MAG: DUF3427 domain-containing protein, partial [Ignavibacteria bacterium]
GYMISKDKSNCAIFVNYHKEDNITHTTMYEDKFIDKSKFEWLSKSKRTLESPDVLCIGNTEKKIRLPLFIKKSNDEGKEFYYMGDVTPIEGSNTQEKMPNSNVSVVKFIFSMDQPVEDRIYYYITNTF